MEVTKETIAAIQAKAEEAKTVYLKWMGALEVMQGMVAEKAEKPKIEKKDKKVKK